MGFGLRIPNYGRIADIANKIKVACLQQPEEAMQYIKLSDILELKSPYKELIEMEANRIKEATGGGWVQWGHMAAFDLGVITA